MEKALLEKCIGIPFQDDNLFFFSGIHNGKAVAIKQASSAISGSDGIKTVMSEALTISKVTPHPNIVQFIGITVPPDPVALVYNIYEGGSLHNYLHGNLPLNLQLKVSILKDIARGMVRFRLFYFEYL